MSPRRNSPLYEAMKSTRSVFEAGDVAALFGQVSEVRVRKLSRRLEEVVGTKLPQTIARRESLADYKTNPYVLMICGGVMELDDPGDFAKFLVDSKLTMGLETSGGKFVQDVIKGVYPIGATEGQYWEDPREKLEEDRALAGLSDQEKAEVRGESSVWQEIDTSCVYGARRYLMSVKSGPNTINDTGKKGIRDAICSNYPQWLEQSQENYGVEGIDVVLGLTYGTPNTTNAKDRQLIAMFLRCGFREEDRDNRPGVLIDETGTVRAYRVVGTGFWSFVADPSAPEKSNFAFLEMLLALAIAVREVSSRKTVEQELRKRLRTLGEAISRFGTSFEDGSLPRWIGEQLSARELFWLAAAMTAFYDEGI